MTSIIRIYVFQFNVFKEYFTNNIDFFTETQKEDFVSICTDADDTDYIIYIGDSTCFTLLPNHAGYEYFFEQTTSRPPRGSTSTTYISSRGDHYCFTYLNTHPMPTYPFNTKELFADGHHPGRLIYRTDVPNHTAATAFSFNGFRHVNMISRKRSFARFSIPTPYVKPAERGVIQNE